MYSPKWSSKLQEEFSAIFDKKKLGISAEKIESQVRMMNKACPDALVMKYESLIESIKLPDENDRHIVAAAIKCNANVIVTYNLKDFPNEYLKSIGLFAVDPDSFIADMIDLSPEKCCDAFREMVLSKKKPPYDEPQYLEVLKRNGLIQTAEELVKYF